MILVISDIHMYMYRRTKNIKPVYADYSIDKIHIDTTLKYIDNLIHESLRECADLAIIYLGDIVDTAYVSECEFEPFLALLKKYKNKTKIIVGNHDSSSTLPENKIKYSPFKYIDLKHVDIVTDYTIEVVDNSILIYLSFKQRKELYASLYNAFSEAKKLIKKKTKDIILLTHNNIYMTETLNEGHMFPVEHINTLCEMLHIPKDIGIQIVNGHIHQTHYEVNPLITDRKIYYFQLGSVSPTSFKKHPIASGAVLIDTKDCSKYKIFDNKKLVLLSIDTPDLLGNLQKILDSGKEYDATIFLKFPIFMEDKINKVIEKYSEIKGIAH